MTRTPKILEFLASYCRRRFGHRAPEALLAHLIAATGFTKTPVSLLVTGPTRVQQRLASSIEAMAGPQQCLYVTSGTESGLVADNESESTRVLIVDGDNHDEGFTRTVARLVEGKPVRILDSQFGRERRLRTILMPPSVIRFVSEAPSIADRAEFQIHVALDVDTAADAKVILAPFDKSERRTDQLLQTRIKRLGYSIRRLLSSTPDALITAGPHLYAVLSSTGDAERARQALAVAAVVSAAVQPEHGGDEPAYDGSAALHFCVQLFKLAEVRDCRPPITPSQDETLKALLSLANNSGASRTTFTGN